MEQAEQSRLYIPVHIVALHKLSGQSRFVEYGSGTEHHIRCREEVHLVQSKNQTLEVAL